MSAAIAPEARPDSRFLHEGVHDAFRLVSEEVGGRISVASWQTLLKIGIASSSAYSRTVGG
jgi:hypothetical protein